MSLPGPASRLFGAVAAGLLLIALLQTGCAPVTHSASLRGAVQPPNLARYVDPFIGTTGDGNVFPGADMPFGMVQWSPDSTAGGLSRPGGYNHGDLVIRGFSLTHLSGAGCVAYGDVPFMPTSRPVRSAPRPNGSPYSDRFIKSSETASPGYYGVRLASGIRVQLTVTVRSGFGLITYPRGSRETLLINAGGTAGAASNIDGPFHSSVRVLGPHLVVGSITSGRFCDLANTYTIYFAASFDRPVASFGTWQEGVLRAGTRSAAGMRAGAYLRFRGGPNRAVKVKVAVSFVSVDNAIANLRAEDPGWSFSTIRKAATEAWNQALARIEVNGGAQRDRTIFYTALYHSLLQPSVFSDANGQYVGFDRRVHLARGYTQYANFSDWDIYRSEMQLLAWLFPRRAGDMMQSLSEDAKQSAWLPRWPFANESTGEMDGDSAAPVIADAYAFGARHFEVRTALGYMMKDASTSRGRANAIVGRPGLGDYLRLGYVRPQIGGWGPTSQTLEYAVDDFAVSRLARSVHDRCWVLFADRSENWKHLFNPATGFIQPRGPNGTFVAPFSPTSMDGFVEGNAIQYTWMVPQDLPGLFRAMGGVRKVAARLDRFFRSLGAGPSSPYYWGGNEVDIQAPWEYDFAARPWRTQAVVRRLMTSLYAATPGGLPGNDDLGTLSSWYVWSALGIFPMVPGVGGFAIGSPLFPRVHVTRTAGARLDILAPQASRGHPYVQGLWLNGRAYGRPWLPLSALGRRHSTLRFALSNRPNREWGTGR